MIGYVLIYVRTKLFGAAHIPIFESGVPNTYLSFDEEGIL